MVSFIIHSLHQISHYKNGRITDKNTGMLEINTPARQKTSREQITNETYAQMTEKYVQTMRTGTLGLVAYLWEHGNEPSGSKVRNYLTSCGIR
jgi:hypothetical protein